MTATLFPQLTPKALFSNLDEAAECLTTWTQLMPRAQATLSIKREGEQVEIEVSYLKYSFTPKGMSTTRETEKVAFEKIALIRHAFKREDEYGGGGWECTNTYTLTFQETDPTTEKSKSVTITVIHTHQGSEQTATWETYITVTPAPVPVPKRQRSPEGV